MNIPFSLGLKSQGFRLGLLALLTIGLTNSVTALTLRAADTQAADYPTVQALVKMADVAKQLSNDDINIKVYAARQLGEEKDTLLATQFGAIDINRISTAPLGNLVPELQILGLPYLFENEAHFNTVVHGEVGEHLLSYLEPHGMVGLAYLTSGARSFYTKTPINSLADFKGLKVRVQNAPLYLDMVRLLGGNPTPMSFGQVYESLVTGVIDAAENNWPSYIATRHFEAAPHYTLDMHSRVPEVIVVSLKRWQKLSPQQQAILKQAAKAAVVEMDSLWAQRVEAAKAAAKAAGVVVNASIDQSEFSRAVAPLYEPFQQNPVHANIIQQIQGLAPSKRLKTEVSP